METAALAACQKMGAILRTGFLKAFERACPDMLLPALHLYYCQDVWTSTAKNEEMNAKKARMEIRVVLMENHDIKREDIHRVLRHKDEVLAVILEDSTSQWNFQADKDQFKAFLGDAVWEGFHYSRGMLPPFACRFGIHTHHIPTACASTKQQISVLIS